MRTSSVLCVALLVVGCGRARDDCRAYADDLVAMLSSAPHDVVLFDPEGTHLVARTDLPAATFEDWPAARVTRTELLYHDDPLTSDAFAAKLKRAHDRILENLELGKVPKGKPLDPRRLYVLIDADAPWSNVVMALRAAADAGFTAPAFAFAHDVKIVSPPRTAIDDELEAATSAHEPSKLGPLFGKHVENCQPARAAFNPGPGDGTREDAIMKGLGPALVQCGCAVDRPLFRSLMWRLLVNPRPTRVIAVDSIEYTLSHSAATLAFAPTTTWDVVSKRLTPETRTFTYAVDDLKTP